jgi:hypothetical protein
MTISKATAQVAAVAAGLAMATSMLSLAPLAHAATGCSVGTADLTLKSTGDAVKCLQDTLIAGGYLTMPAGVMTGYFGTLTQTAVGKWQAAVGVSPTAGYFGAKSRAAFTGTAMTGGTSMVPGCTAGAMYSSTTGAMCTTTTTVVPGCTAGAMFSSTTGAACGTTTTTTAGLTGAGRLTNVTNLGSVTTNIKEGDAVTSVVGLSADATGGDVSLQRVDATFVIGGTTGSANLNRYVSDVSLWLDGTKIASMDPALGDKSSRTWTVRFAGLNGVIKNNKTGNLYVKVTPLSSIGTNENGVSITASIGTDGVRAVSADGISDTYVASGDAISHAFNVATATTGAVNVTTASDNPVAGGITAVSTTAATLTPDVKLLSMNVKATNAEVIIDSLPIRLSTSDNNIGDVVSSVKLMKGTTVLSTKSVTNGVSTTTFNNLNLTVKKDETANFTVVVDLLGTGAAYSEGTTITASSTTVGWDITDSNGASVTPTGSVTGNDVTLRSIGLAAATAPTSATATKSVPGTGTQETGTFTFTFNVTAFGADMYVSSTTNGFTPTSVYDGSGVATTTGAYAITSSAARSAGNNYVIYSGQTKTVTISFTKLGQAGYALAKLLTLKFGTSDATALTSSLTFTTDYQTAPIYLAD